MICLFKKNLLFERLSLVWKCIGYLNTTGLLFSIGWWKMMQDAVDEAKDKHLAKFFS